MVALYTEQTKLFSACVDVNATLDMCRALGMISCLHLYKHILVTLTFKDWGQNFLSNVALTK